MHAPIRMSTFDSVGPVLYLVFACVNFYTHESNRSLIVLYAMGAHNRSR
jgi:hypothetical protein